MTLQYILLVYVVCYVPHGQRHSSKNTC